MALIDAVFYLFALIVLGSAALVVFSKNILYSAFSLLFTFFGVAGLYVLLNADFLAVTQIMIYIGGILVLIIFGVMLTRRVQGVDIKEGSLSKIQIGIMGFTSALMAALLAWLFTSAEWHTAPAGEIENTVQPIGNILLTDYLIAFEVASVLLLIAIIGAALIARKKA